MGKLMSFVVENDPTVATGDVLGLWDREKVSGSKERDPLTDVEVAQAIKAEQDISDAEAIAESEATNVKADTKNVLQKPTGRTSTDTGVKI